MNIEEIYANIPTLETERLRLRKVTLADAEDMYAYGSNEEVAKYVTWEPHQSLADTEEYIRLIIGHYQNKQSIIWGIEYKDNGKFIGTIDFISWRTKHRVGEIGYVLSQDYWRKGLMTEAAKEVVKFGFERMKLVRIQARCLIDNIGSQGVLENVGMTFEGVQRKGIFLKGKHHDFKMYSILKEEFV